MSPKDQEANREATVTEKRDDKSSRRTVALLQMLVIDKTTENQMT